MTAQIGISTARLLDVCRDVISTAARTNLFGIICYMADREFSLLHPDNARNDKSSNEERVETWRSHPSHRPTTPYEMLRNTNHADRRRPENARIRRWMELADRALNSGPDDDSTAA